MTGGSFAPAARDFLARVSNPCLQKPFSRAAIVEAMSSVLGTGATPRL
jgi:hypothetical protein